MKLIITQMFSNNGDISCSPNKKKCSFYRLQKRSLGQGNVFTRVCHFVHRGVGFLPLGPWEWGFCLWVWDVCAHTSEHPPQDTHPPNTHTHRWTHTPATVNKQAVRILLESFLVLFCVNYLPDTLSHMNQNRLKGGAQCKMVPRCRTRYIWPHVERQNVIQELGCGKIKKREKYSQA